jgi:hypothetical protein
MTTQSKTNIITALQAFNEDPEATCWECDSEAPMGKYESHNELVCQDCGETRSMPILSAIDDAKFWSDNWRIDYPDFTLDDSGLTIGFEYTYTWDEASKEEYVETALDPYDASDAELNANDFETIAKEANENAALYLIDDEFKGEKAPSPHGTIVSAILDELANESGIDEMDLREVVVFGETYRCTENEITAGDVEYRWNELLEYRAARAAEEEEDEDDE